jgi:hypothetical protein
MRTESSRDVLVSSMRVRSCALRAGCVAIVSTAARTGDGALVAARQSAVHVAAEPERPRTAAAAKRIASALLEALDLRAALPDVNGWFADVRRVHETAIDARVAREREIREPAQNKHAVQPGLFDRRAVSAADRAADAAERLLEAHRSEIEALERSRELRLTCSVSAVLILWR